ncbi:hypothetical protein BGZ83_008269 [Gryganskiella cystojenkinii]|nr:hypothetical protein BGZ83_008269 [Gryganskiella cystojenkinii]
MSGSASLLHPSTTVSSSTTNSSTFPALSAPPSRHPSPHVRPYPDRSQSPRPLTPPPSRTNQYSDWATVREKERARLLGHLTSFRETLGAHVIVPPPRARQLARENLLQLSERIRRRRARARETILYDLHQGVKSVEAQVHKQVEMVLSRLKDAPGSRYAFALTHSFLSQIPALTAYTGAYSEEGGDTRANAERQPTSELRGHGEDLSTRRNQEDHDLESAFDDVALACSSHNGDDSEASKSEEKHSIAISRSGQSEVLSAYLSTSYSTACSQLLSAALPSFIPSMVAPLVCVFNYPAPPMTASRSADKGFVYPWGLPDDGRLGQASTVNTSSSASPSVSPENVESNSSTLDHQQEADHQHPQIKQEEDPRVTPDPGILVLHSKSWTQAEREALYLAATRFRLQGQWSKIREMMNLHRTDKEIETEYKKLYCPREDGAIDEDDDDSEVDDRKMDDDEELEAMQGMQSSDSGMDEDQDRIHHGLSENHNNNSTSRPNYRRRRAATTDGEADDEADHEPIVFMKFGGTHPRRSQIQVQDQLYQQRQSHYYPQGLHSTEHLQGQPQLQQYGMAMTGGDSSRGGYSRDSSPPQQLQSTLSLYPIPNLSSPAGSRPLTPHDVQEGGEPIADPRQSVITAGAPATELQQPKRILYKSEFMIDKRFTLEEIPMRI